MPSLPLTTSNWPSPANSRMRNDSRFKQADLLNFSSTTTRARLSVALAGFSKCWRNRMATFRDSPT